MTRIFTISLTVAVAGLLFCGAVQADGLSFTDITESAGTGGPTGNGMTGGHGAMFADIDSDGRSDLYITMIWSRPMPDLFFRNIDGKKFVNEGVKRGLVGKTDSGAHGLCFADLDNDGDYDAVRGLTYAIGNIRKPGRNQIKRNDGKGKFTDVTDAAGIPRDRKEPTRGVIAFDMDDDGDLDIFCVSGAWGSKKDRPGEKNEVYRNDGKMKFTPITTGSLVTCPAGQGATDTDLDGDGDIDVIAANRTGPVNILINDGAGKFKLIKPESLGIKHPAKDGATTADVDNDGDLDLLLAGDDYGHLYLNNGKGKFAHKQSFTGTAGYMGGFADLDNDGDLDLVFAGDKKVYLNDGAGNFTPGPKVPVAGINDPRGIAFADIDNDGDIDFALGVKRSRNFLIRNNFNSGNWLKVKLISPKGQAGAFGAKTRIYAAGRIAGKRFLGMRESRSNNGYLGQDDPVLHFGLGGHKSVDVVVTFPGSKEITIHGSRCNRTLTINAKQLIEQGPILLGGGAGPKLDKTSKQWVPIEWGLINPGHKGNPYDLVAKVTFVHEKSSEKIVTGMFYAGKDTWKFRFTGTKPGKWTFATSSDVKALNRKRGIVTVAPNPKGRGFVTGFGNKWGYSGTGEVFVPQLVMYLSPDKYYKNPKLIDADIKTFLVEHGFNGFHTNVFCRWFDIGQGRAGGLKSKDPNPDPRTFEALELLITKTYAAGGMVHIWAWGDEQRAMTPIRLGGKNGPADKRLQRYIAARLGPIPGWTMGYGFDLNEWTKEKDLRGWHDYMHKHMGWKHMLGGRSVGPNRYKPGIKFPQIYEGLDYFGYEQHRPTYEAYVAAIDARPKKPAFSEDRFRVRKNVYPDKDYNLEMTRRGLWHSTMAGGVANIWGYLLVPKGQGGSNPYPKPEWIKTWSVFFKHRFVKDMVRNNKITDGVCLTRPTRAHYVFYKEDAVSIKMDLSRMAGAQKAVAVDTLKPYKEIPLGSLKPEDQTWKAPYKSDWAVAVGEYEKK